MNRITLRDFFPSKNVNFVEDDKTKAKRLEKELQHFKSINEKLTSKCDDLQSENFALKIQLQEFQMLKSESANPSSPLFAKVAANPISNFSKRFKSNPSFNKSTLVPTVSKTHSISNIAKQSSISSKSSPVPTVPSPIPINKHEKNIIPKSDPIRTPKISQNQKPFSNEKTPNNFSHKNSSLFETNVPFQKIPTHMRSFQSDARKASFPPSPPKFPSNFQPSKNHPTKISPQKVFIYHDSNLAWSLPSTIEETVKNINTYRPHPIQNVSITKCYTPRLVQTLDSIKTTNHSNSVVIIAVMTNNAKANQSVAYSKSILNKIFEHLKTEISAQNIIVLESPPSLNFDIFPYNKVMFDLCQSNEVFFARNLLKKVHMKGDGLHILNHYKHLMVKSVAAAIKKIDPKRHYRLPNNWYVS